VLLLIGLLPLLIVLAVAVPAARRRPYVPFRSRLKGLVLASAIAAMLSLVARGELIQLLHGEAGTPDIVGYLIGEAVGGVLACLIAALAATGARLLVDAAIAASKWALAAIGGLVLAALVLSYVGLGVAVGAIVLAGVLVHGIYLGLATLRIIRVPQPPPEHDALKRVFE
jgi:hypothetical protein